MPLNALIVLPGRGSFRPEHLGTLIQDADIVKDADSIRRQDQQLTVSELANAPKFSANKHIAGENASILTAAYTLAEFEKLKSDINVLAICGNSMGWYTTLIASGALSSSDGLKLIEQMGQYQVNNQIGAQLLYPLYTEDWHLDHALSNQIEQLIQETHGLHWSIVLGHQAVLGGSKRAIKHIQENLAPITQGALQFPLILPMHSAFHTPLMHETSLRACQDLKTLNFRSPRIPIFDGRGVHWRPHTTKPHELMAYTLTTQVTEVFNFKRMIQSAVQEYAPDCIIHLGPGGNLGGAIAQSLIEIGWSGLNSKADFLERQKSAPIILASDRSEQRSQFLR